MNKFKFEINGEVEIFESHHCAILAMMFNNLDYTTDRDKLDHYASLVAVVLQPHDHEYDIAVHRGTIVINRFKVNSKLNGTRLAIIKPA